MKKHVSLILAFAMLLVSMASCSENSITEESEETKKQLADNPLSQAGDVAEIEEIEEEKLYLDDLPEKMDLGGESIRFIVEEGGNGNLTELSIMAEEDTGEVVDSAVYQRNSIVQDRLNVSIDLVNVVEWQSLPQIVRTAVQSDSDEYDIIGTYQYYGVQMGPEGLFMNLNNLDNLDLTREYWAADYIENMSYNGVTYWATGDIALRYTGGMYVSYVNQSIWNDYYSDTNIYDIVNEGAWTLDKLYEVSNTVYEDTNGNTRRDRDDVYGFIFDIEDPVEGMAAGSLVRFAEVDESGTPYVALGNERSYTFYEKIYKLLYQNDGLFHAEDDSKTVMNMFAENKAMVTVNKLFMSGIYLREMEEEFRIVPVPKLEEAQEHYNTMLHDGVTLFGIPVTNSKVEATSITLECLASESLKTVTPAYYDVSLKVKYARDNESGQMIDLIRENVSSDFAAIYSKSISDIAHFFRTNLTDKSESIASSLEKKIKLYTKAIGRVLENIEKNGGQ